MMRAACNSLLQVLRQQVSELTRVVQEQGAALQQLQRDNDAKSVAQNGTRLCSYYSITSMKHVVHKNTMTKEHSQT